MGGWGVGKGVWRLGEREVVYLSLHCHHQNDLNESRFNVSLIVMDKVTRPCPQTTTSEEKGEPKRYRTEVLPLTSLLPYRQAKPALTQPSLLLHCCFTSTEARWLIRDGDRGGRGRQSEGSTAETARKRPERPWTAARTVEVLRRCPLAIAQRLVHCAIAVSTAVLGQSHKDNVRCTAVDEQLGRLEAK